MNESLATIHERWAWLRGAGVLMLGNLANVVVSVVVGLALARDLGPKELGIFGVATTSTLLLSTLSTLRLEAYLLVRFDRSDNDRREYGLALRSSLTTFVPIAIVTCSVGITVIGQGYRTLAVLVLVEVFLAPLMFARVLLQVRMRQASIVLSSVIGRGVWLVAVGVLVATGNASPVTVVATRIASTLVEAYALHRASQISLIAALREHVARSEVLATIRHALPLAASGITGEAYSRLDQPLIAAMRGSREAGLYSAGVRLADLTGVHSPIVQSVVAPALVEHHRSGNREGVRRAMRDGLLLSLVPGGLLVAAVVVHAEWLATTLLGNEFRDSAPMISILALAEWTTFVAAAYGTALIAEDRRARLLVANVVGLPINVAINFAFVPDHGGVAAAWSSLIAYSVVMVALMLGSPSLRGEFWTGANLIMRCGFALAVGVGVGYAGPRGIALNQLLAVVAQSVALVAVFPAEAARAFNALNRLIETRRPRRV